MSLAELWRASWVIARRDYVATVVSRSFLLFLCAPLFPLLFGGVFATLNRHTSAAPSAPTLAVVAPASEGSRLVAARSRLEEGGADLPELRVVTPSGDPERQARALLTAPGQRPDAVLLPGNRLMVHAGDTAFERPAALLLDEAARDAALARAGATPAPVRLAVDRIARAPAGSGETAAIARGGQFLLFFLTLMLATMLLSNMVEEKSNKVIEVLAAAVPVRAIFLGKLGAMLCISLTGLLVWGALAAITATLALPASALAVAPAVGWPLFAILTFVYFACNYLLFGALFLGIGSQASSVREVQVLSMPITMAQLIVFAFASSAVGLPLSGVGRAATIMPWSSPIAMLAQAAQTPQLWPHLLAIAWQLLWVAISVVIAAGRFRANVLKSGGTAPARSLLARRASRH